MVYVNSVKYACESCIKGHRSSSCHHNERPLFEIKKKGRPVSQCEKCRELRQSKRVHGKCNCAGATNSSSEGVTGQVAVVEPVTKKILPGKRFIPITPSLPNGLKDALKQSNGAADVLTSRSSVDALLNPCQCKGSECNCNGPRSGSTLTQSLPRCKPIDPSIFNDGLSALALVASCCFPASSKPTTSTTAGTTASTPEPSGCCSGAAKSVSTLTGMSSKAAGKRKRSPSPPTVLYDYYVEGPSPRSSQPSRPLPPLPFSHLAPTSPLSIFKSSSPSAAQSTAPQATDECCCGTRCECAGCQLHNALQNRNIKTWVDVDSDEAVTSFTSVSGPSIVSRPNASLNARTQQHSRGCGPDCPTCVDHDGGVELPPIHHLGTEFSSITTILPSRPPPPSFITEYFSRTASSSSSSTQIQVLPPTRETIDARWRAALGEQQQQHHHHRQQPRRLFAITQAPAPAKLDACCSGACGCGESCGCGYECDGCCLPHAKSNFDRPSTSTSMFSALASGSSSMAETATATPIHPIHMHHHRQSSVVEHTRTRVSRSPSVSYAREASALVWNQQHQQPRDAARADDFVVTERPPEKRHCCCPK